MTRRTRERMQGQRRRAATRPRATPARTPSLAPQTPGAAPRMRRVNGAAAPSGGGPAVQGEAVGGERDGLARRPWRRRGQEVSVVRHMVFGCMGLCEMASGGCDCFALLACRACEPGVEPGVRSSFGPCLPGLGVAHWPSIARADRCSALDAQRLVKQD